MSEAEYTWPQIFEQFALGASLTTAQANWAMGQCISGIATPAQMAGLIIGLRAKPVTASELLGFVEATVAAARPTKLPQAAVDIVGTGGDNFGTVNVSTTAAFVIAAAGIPVVKHGNRAASSLSGMSDVLTALGGKHNLSDSAQQQVFNTTNIAFLHAAFMHPGFANVAPVRSELGVASVFNFLGPLCNPARVRAVSLGVADGSRAKLMAQVLLERKQSALVVHGQDGLDELTTTCNSDVLQVANGKITPFEVDPARLGIPRANITDLKGGTPLVNAQIMRDTLTGKIGPVRDIVLLNAASGIVAYNLFADPKSAALTLEDRFAAALELAAAAIDGGQALAKLNTWVTETSARADLS